MAEEKEPAEKPKTAWDRIVTITPVLLTVISTLLAGLSSGEMTRAQYHRALAAQNQSKASDQWSFFQAKKIRGTEVELFLERLAATSRPGTITAAMVRSSYMLLVGTLQDIREKASQLDQSSAKSEDAAHRPALDAFLRHGSAGQGLASASKRLDAAMQDPKLFEYVGTRALPDSKSLEDMDQEARDALNDAQLSEVVKAIGDRKPTASILGMVKPIMPETIQAGIRGAEARNLAVDKSTDPYSDQIDKITNLIQELLGAVALAHQVAVMAELGSSSPSNSGPMQAFLRSETKVKSAADELNRLWQVARYDFTLRRYKREASENQRTATMFEVQVYKSGATSENHALRSRFFFLGMLGAQAGVTISSLALAAKQKSMLWTVATLAGVSALIFSAWVYLSM